jgi:hypothetical protein
MESVLYVKGALQRPRSPIAIAAITDHISFPTSWISAPSAAAIWAAFSVLFRFLPYQGTMVGGLVAVHITMCAVDDLVTSVEQSVLQPGTIAEPKCSASGALRADWNFPSRPVW